MLADIQLPVNPFILKISSVILFTACYAILMNQLQNLTNCAPTPPQTQL